jgi:hypothetical protein
MSSQKIFAEPIVRERVPIKLRWLYIAKSRTLLFMFSKEGMADNLSLKARQDGLPDVGEKSGLEHEVSRCISVSVSI